MFFTLTPMRSRLLVAGAALLVAFAVAPVAASPRSAQEDLDPAKNDARITELREDIGHAASEESAALDELAGVQATRAEAEGRLGDAQAKVEEAGAAVAAAQEEYDRVAAAYFGAEAELEETERKVAAARAEFEAAVVELYSGSGGIDLATVASGADDVRELIAGSQYIEEVSDGRRETVDGYVDRRDEIAALRDELGIQRDEAQALQEELEARRDELAALRDKEAAAVAAVAEEEAAEETIIAGIRDRKDEFAAELAALEAESQLITQLIRERQRAQPVAPPTDPETGEPSGEDGDGTGGGSGQFMRPVPGAITSTFGSRVHPITGVVTQHDGLDFGSSCGTSIQAAGSGEVLSAAWQGGYGNTVIIDHGGGIATLYGHQSGFAVGTGQTVSSGEVIGYVGSTGFSTGCHLHWEVRVNGVPTDPLAYL